MPPHLRHLRQQLPHPRPPAIGLVVFISKVVTNIGRPVLGRHSCRLQPLHHDFLREWKPNLPLAGKVRFFSTCRVNALLNQLPAPLTPSTLTLGNSLVSPDAFSI